MLVKERIAVENPAINLNHSVQSRAKCILTGAHSVLRGKLAIACSIPTHLKIQHQAHQHQYGVIYRGLRHHEAEKNFIPFLSYALKLCKKKLQDFPGILTLTNQIPIGSGLGSSAALCGAVAQLFALKGLISSSNSGIITFAHKLEHYFHGKSSGLDVLASHTPPGKIRLLEKNQHQQHSILWHPYIALSPSGIEANTKKAIQTVETWRQKNIHCANEVDQIMHNSSLLCQRALLEKNLDRTSRFAILQQSFAQSRYCYQQWGLIPQKVTEVENRLTISGAFTTLTGGGLGGYIISLWPSMPDTSTQKNHHLTWVFPTT